MLILAILSIVTTSLFVVLAKNVFSSQNDSKFLKTLFIISIIFGFCTSVGGGILAWKELNQRTESANLKQLEKKLIA
jgi:hypothetical protein